MNVRRAHTDGTTYQVPVPTEELELPTSVPVPIATAEPDDEEVMDQLFCVPPAGKYQNDVLSYSQACLNTLILCALH